MHVFQQDRDSNALLTYVLYFNSARLGYINNCKTSSQSLSCRTETLCYRQNFYLRISSLLHQDSCFERKFEIISEIALPFMPKRSRLPRLEHINSLLQVVSSNKIKSFSIRQNMFRIL